MAAVPPLLRLSTDELPVRDRIPIWCEEFSRTMLKVEFEPVAGCGFRQAAELYAFGGLGILHAKTDGVIVRLDKAQFSENFIFHIKTSGSSLGSQMGRELEIDTGEAALFAAYEMAANHFPGSAYAINLHFPRRTLASLVHDPDGMTARRVPADTPALRLLVDYLGLVMEKHELEQVGLQQLFATHVLDLVALTLGATRDASELAQARGLRAARLQAIKADIACRFAQEGLSVSDVASRFGVTPRYVHMLFEPEGRTFSEFLIEQRLAQAHRMLTDPRLAARTISAIAFDAGFANLSYFNRLFRRRYGASPSDVRAAARNGE